MKNRIVAIIISCIAFASCTRPKSPHFRLSALPAQDVRWTSGFRADRFDIFHRGTIPAIKSSFNDPRNTGARHGPAGER